MTNKELNAEFISAKRRLFDKVFGERLNPEQCRAVFTAKGPLLVLAGAGSGKTTVLVNRIAYLIKYGNAYYDDTLPEGVDEGTVAAFRAAYNFSVKDIEDILPQFISEPTPPWQILAFTFTNKAAGEIKDRLLSRFGDEELARSVWAGTFHSICLRILRKYGDRLGYREGFSVYDADDAKRLITDCMKELDLDPDRLKPKDVANAISKAKDELTTADEYTPGFDPRGKEIRQIYELYTKKLMDNNAVDFDDIIMQTVMLLEGEPDVREYYQKKFKYVLVDEYQDTNHAQFVLTKLLAGGYNNLMVVGDDDQSIYRFRGATVENILNFDKTYPNATVVKLEQNYRSTSNILGAANAVIKNNEHRHDKSLWCNKGKGALITVKEAFDQNAEGKYIVEEIILSKVREKRQYSDYAVLYRIRQLGRTLETAFAKSGIPYRVVGDTNFYERKEIKDMLAYLNVVASGEDNLRLKRIINEPKRKIGGATVDAIEAISNATGRSMLAVMENADEYIALAKNKEKLRGFVDLIHGLRREDATPSELIELIYKRSGYEKMLSDEGFEGRGKIENIEELISAAVEFEKKAEENGTDATLGAFLDEISLITSVDKYDENADAVVLMTVHAAKGLEFPVVFIAGMEDGIFPSESDMLDKNELGEERRLAYVAITRAKEKLYITYAKSRMLYGRTAWGKVSRFVDEIPSELKSYDRPKTAPPRQTGYGYASGAPRERVSENSEMRRSINTSRPTTRDTAKTGAARFGVSKLSVGTRVSHAAFGAGTVISSRDMAGDVLYEVRFDSGVTKKLMATFAKLTKL